MSDEVCATKRAMLLEITITPMLPILPASRSMVIIQRLLEQAHGENTHG